MYKKGFIMWGASLCVFVLAVVPFIFFMFKPSSKNLAIAISVIAVGAILYIIGTKLMTHKLGFTALQAIRFYKDCYSHGFEDAKQCKKNYEEFMKIASEHEGAKKLDLQSLYEMYNVGAEISAKKKG